MDRFESLSHTVWECKYHVAFIPKCRRKVLYASLRPHLGEVFRRLAEQKESRVEEGHLMPDHVHMLLSIPPKYAVSDWTNCRCGNSHRKVAPNKRRGRVSDSAQAALSGSHRKAPGFAGGYLQRLQMRKGRRP